MRRVVDWVNYVPLWMSIRTARAFNRKGNSASADAFRACPTAGQGGGLHSEWTAGYRTAVATFAGLAGNASDDDANGFNKQRGKMATPERFELPTVSFEGMASGFIFDRSLNHLTGFEAAVREFLRDSAVARSRISASTRSRLTIAWRWRSTSSPPR
jgi:hypothetical protein